MDQLLIDCTARVKVPTGSVRKLVSPKGKLVKELDELEDGACLSCPSLCLHALTLDSMHVDMRMNIMVLCLCVNEQEENTLHVELRS